LRRAVNKEVLDQNPHFKTSSTSLALQIEDSCGAVEDEILVEEANSNSGQITTDNADFPFVCFVCRINVLEAAETIQTYYGCYFYAVIYTRTRILPRKGFGGRLTVIGIATF
jgi:hypothetical protein